LSALVDLRVHDAGGVHVLAEGLGRGIRDGTGFDDIAQPVPEGEQERHPSVLWPRLPGWA
jgi:hypothetical protein